MLGASLFSQKLTKVVLLEVMSKTCNQNVFGTHTRIREEVTTLDDTAREILKADAIFHVDFRIPIQIIHTFCAKGTKKKF